MFTNTFNFICIFLLTLSILNVVKNAYSLAKVFVQQDGKLETDTTSVVLFACSISYIIACIFAGF